jgi:glycosyltransferase involved in cell wall biosynthesis
LVGTPIRLLYFLNSPGVPGGVEEHVYLLMRDLPPSRFEVSLVCPTSLYEMFAPLETSRRRVFPLDLNHPSQLHAMKRLRTILRQHRTEIAHGHQFIATLFLAPVATASGVPVVIETPHLGEVWRRSWLKRSLIIDRLVYTQVDHFIAISKANQRYLIEKKRVPPGKIAQIYSGRDLDAFLSDELSGLMTRREYGISLGDRVIVHVGRLTAQKGHSYLLRALPEVKSRIPNLKVLLVGDGELRNALEREVRRQHLVDTVLFCGFQKSIARFFHAADLVVLPSLFEGLPLVAIEAAAAGKPMVATDVDGTPEIVQHNMTGLLVPPCDSTLLADALGSLLSDEPRRAAMGAAARRFALKGFTLEEFISRHAELYTSLAERYVAGRRVLARRQDQ